MSTCTDDDHSHAPLSEMEHDKADGWAAYLVEQTQVAAAQLDRCPHMIGMGILTKALATLLADMTDGIPEDVALRVSAGRAQSLIVAVALERATRRGAGPEEIERIIAARETANEIVQEAPPPPPKVAPRQAVGVMGGLIGALACEVYDPEATPSLELTLKRSLMWWQALCAMTNLNPADTHILVPSTGEHVTLAQHIAELQAIASPPTRYDA